jgi:ferredoxin
MKTDLYYFTGTGNSLALSKILSENIKNSQIKSMIKLLKNTKIEIENEIIGFVFPNHYGKVPNIVKEFIINCNLEKVKYIFAVISGGGGAGYAFNDLKNILKQKKSILNAACEIVLPSNYIIAPYYTHANRDDSMKKILFEDSKKRIISFAEVIKEKKNVFDIKNSTMRSISKLFNIPNNLSNRKIWDKNFNSDSKCNLCGICEKVCPVGNIKIVNDKLAWNQNCQLCMACIQLCPKEAIQYKKETLNKKRYHHPEIQLSEIIYEK